MTQVTRINGSTNTVLLTTTMGVITKVEKWSETNVQTTTDVSGGGGFIYQGTGHVNPTNVQVTTSSTTTRHTRIYYTEDGRQKQIAATGFDLPVLEGSQLSIVWYRSNGFEDKIAGFADLASQQWFLLNDSAVYFSSWMGLSWIDIPYLVKFTAVVIGIAGVCALIHPLFGLFIGILLAIGWLIALGKIMVGYLFNRGSYCHRSELARAEIDLRKQVIAHLSGPVAVPV